MLYSLGLFEEAGESGGIGWMVWVALAIFFVMVFLGWLASSKGWLRKEEEPVQVHHEEHGHDEPAHEHVAHEEAYAPVAHVTEAAPQSQVVEVTPAKPDDLTELEGIGPKVAQVLAGAGITTFKALTTADKAKLQEALNAAGYKYMDPSGWIEQAELAAKGDVEGLKKLQGELKGGRRA